jgi:hypothetical protein
MQSSKYISPLFQDLYTKRYVTHNETKLRTVYLFSIIDTFLHRWQLSNKDNLKLNTRVLKSLYGSTYPRYLEYLADNDFIFLYRNYSAGLKSKTYKLTDVAKKAGTLTVNIDMPDRLISKMRAISLALNTVDECTKNKLVRDLYRVSIDMDGAKSWIESNMDRSDRAFEINLSTCDKIKAKDIYYSFDAYGRFHTNFTVLKKEIRSRFLRFGDEPVMELDITNSQPFFLYILMRDAGFSDFDGFDADVLSGSIYERLREISGRTRREVKVNVYSVLFGRNMTPDYWNLLFGELYPNVYAWIREYKRTSGSYKAIARELQRIESNFIFNNLIPDVVLRHGDLPIVTIHDSIVIPRSAYADVRQIFQDAKAKLVSSTLAHN